jgi:hypothetical protein
MLFQRGEMVLGFKFPPLQRGTKGDFFDRMTNENGSTHLGGSR